MSDRKFITTVIVISVIGILVTFAHMAYIYYAYQNSSIIHYIAEEIW